MIGRITNILPRKNELIRPAVANIDNVFFVNCIVQPAIDLLYMDKFLFCAAAANINVTIILNKTDLLEYPPDDIINIYEEIGYTVLQTNIKDEKTICAIEDIAENKISVFAGQSGVGKSSIMQILFPDKHFAVRELSKSLLRGKNTTTATSLLQLPNGGYIADSPGFSVFDTPDIAPQFVASYFIDIADILDDACCKFSDCSHINEPDCCVKGNIAESRYKSYLAIYDEMTARSKVFR